MSLKGPVRTRSTTRGRSPGVGGETKHDVLTTQTSTGQGLRTGGVPGLMGVQETLDEATHETDQRVDGRGDETVCLMGHQRVYT